MRSYLKFIDKDFLKHYYKFILKILLFKKLVKYFFQNIQLRY